MCRTLASSKPFQNSNTPERSTTVNAPAERSNGEPPTSRGRKRKSETRTLDYVDLSPPSKARRIAEWKISQEVAENVDDESPSTTAISEDQSGSGTPRDEAFGTVRTDVAAAATVFDEDAVAFAKGLRTKQVRILSHVLPSGLAYPPSLYGAKPRSVSSCSEEDALKHLLRHWREAQRGRHPADKADFIELQLSDFTFYKWAKGPHHDEMVPLNALKVEIGCDELYFDGIISVGAEKRYVEAIRFETLSVDGYCDDITYSTDVQLYIQSDQASMHGVWYRLTAANQSYARFHAPFCWYAAFTKHVIDFLDTNERVTLTDFERTFHKWLLSRHGGSTRFQAWLRQFAGPDYRCHIAANIGYLWKESYSVVPEVHRHPLWAEVHPDRLNAIVQQPPVECNTIVSEFVYRCFQELYFADKMEARNITDCKAQRKRWLRKRSLGMLEEDSLMLRRAPLAIPIKPSPIKVGDVVGVPRDETSTWRDDAEIWLGYVQDIRKNKKNERLLDLIWLYRPSDTILGTMKYPIEHELFMSNNCNCGDGHLKDSDVVHRVIVSWALSGREMQTDGYIVRQKYMSSEDPEDGEHAFVTLQESDFVCSCKTTPRSSFHRLQQEYGIGATVLYRPNRLNQRNEGTCERLDIGVIERFEEHSLAVTLRRLIRRGHDNSRDFETNELAWTSSFCQTAAASIIRKCFVRAFSRKEVNENKVPAPYICAGTGNHFFVVDEAKNDHTFVPFNVVPPSLQQGFDPAATLTQPKLQMLELFSGGGNFGRALEDSGSVQCVGAVDWDSTALHTYRANTTDPDAVAFFLGSIDDYIAKVMEGSTSKHIVQINNVDLIVAGSPCPGFSLAQQDKMSDQSRRNASKVASALSAVDLYRPQYFLFENVIGIAHRVGANKDTNVFAQMQCTLVAMGYQTTQYLLDSWRHGSSQSRSRVFICAAAPGLTPMQPPSPSHGHPVIRRKRALGEATNGLKFGLRSFEEAPFGLETAGKATEDLPFIDDGQVQLCVPFPDHRPDKLYNAFYRSLMAVVPVASTTPPTLPPALKLSRAIEEGRVSAGLVEEIMQSKNAARWTDPRSKSFQRVNRHGLFPTIMTKLGPHDARGHSSLHWLEPRALSIMEARRAQGFLDHAVIVGRTADQWKIIGNSVCRQVAVALGLRLREAWLANASPSPSNSITALHERVKAMTGITAKSEITDRPSNVQEEESQVDELVEGDVITRKETSIRRTAVVDEQPGRSTTTENISIVTTTTVKHQQASQSSQQVKLSTDVADDSVRQMHREESPDPITLIESPQSSAEPPFRPSPTQRRGNLRINEVSRPVEESPNAQRRGRGRPRGSTKGKVEVEHALEPMERSSRRGDADLFVPENWSKIPGKKYKKTG